MALQPVVVIVAGPNGSGKSSTLQYLKSQKGITFPLVTVNADELSLRLAGGNPRLISDAISLQAQVLAQDEIEALFRNRTDFSFETVFSHPSKLALIQQALDIGYIVTLIFVCLEYAQLNVLRVLSRMASGGHPVPESKVVERRVRSLKLLASAAELASTTFLIDNTGLKPELIARMYGRMSLELAIVPRPEWVTNFFLLPMRSRESERIFLSEKFPLAEKASIILSRYLGKLEFIGYHYLLQISDHVLVRHDLDLIRSLVADDFYLGQKYEIRYTKGKCEVETWSR